MPAPDGGAGRPVRVLFWGTPEFAIPMLEALDGEGHHIVGVVTQPDRPAGRGRALKPGPVKAWAIEEGYPVLQPDRPRGPEFLDELRALRPEVSVVAAYGHILVQEVLDLPAQGSINVHASLLPKLRGAAPINWAVARCHEETGVTIMRMVRKMDAGPILLQAAEPIGPDDTASELTGRLAELGAELLVEALALLEADAAEEVEQDHAQATFAPKVDRATARIDWTESATRVSCHVRGMDRVPGAWSDLDGQPVKLFRPEVTGDGEQTADPGTVLTADAASGLRIAAGEGAVAFAEVQPPGRVRMPAADWIRGRGVRAGQRFT